MPTTIDSLQIEINASAQEAQTGIEALVTSLEKLENATKSCRGLSSFSKKLEEFGESINRINPMSASVLKQLGEALNEFKDAGNIKISSTVGKQIAQIASAANGITVEAIANLRTLAPAISSLSSVRDVRISSTIGKGIAEIVEATKQIDVDELSKISELSSAIASLTNIQDIRISSSFARQIVNLGIAAEQLQGIDLTVFGNLAEALHPLSELGKATNMTSMITQLKKLPSVIESLEEADLDAFTERIERLVSALEPLATQMTAISNGFSNFPREIRQATQATENMESSESGAIKSITDLYSAVQLAGSAVKQTSDKLAEWINLSNTYVEDVNLFTASLGRYAQQAKNFAENVGDLVGIDPGEWMRAQGIFYNLADGFGVASNRAYLMSQQLTQLSYDLASFYNLRVEDAMLKIRGGLSGEIEMMRQLGVDLSNAAMQERAHAMGIDEKVTAMTQAQKAQLRYLIMIERTTTAQGDMVRTLDTPANQLRVLTAQTTQAARALGNIFIPMLNAILPYAIAAARAVRVLASAIASLFGYSLPSIDYSGVGDAASSAGDLADNLESAGGSAKKLKHYLLGFDEINQIPMLGSGGGGGGSATGSDDWNWELPTYDFLDGLISTRVDAIYKKIEPVLNWVTAHLNGILAIAKSIAVSMGLWKVAKQLMPELSMVQTDISNLLTLALGLGTIVVSAKLSYDFTNDFMATGDIGNLIASGITTALSSFIIFKSFSKVTNSAKAGQYMAGISLTLNTAMELRAIYKGVRQDGFSPKALEAGINAVLTGGAAGGFLSYAAGSTIVGGVMAGGLLTITIGGIVLIAALVAHAEDKAKEIDWGDVHLTREEVEEQVKRFFTIDTTATINLIKTTIANKDSVQTELDNTLTEVNAKLNKIVLGVEVTQEEVESVTTKLVGEGGIIDQLSKSAEEKAATIQLMVHLVPPQSSEGADLSADLLTAVGISQQLITTVGNDIGTRLSNTIQSGMLTGFANGEMKMVAELTQWLNRITSAGKTSQLTATFGMNVEELLNSVDRESFSELLKEYSAQKDALSEAFTNMEKQSYIDTQTYVAQLEVVKQYLTEMGELDSASVVQNQIDEMNKVLEEWDVNASVDKAVGAVTAETDEKILEVFRNKFDSNLSNVATNYSLRTNIKSTLANPTWMVQFGSDGNDLIEFEKNLNEAFKSVLSKEDYKVFLDMQDHFELTGWDLLTTDTQKALYDMLNSVLGKDGDGNDRVERLFMELGYDLSGVLADGLEGKSEDVKQATEEIVSGSAEAMTAMTEATDELTTSLGESSTALSDVVTGIEACNESGINAFTPVAVGAQESAKEVENLKTIIVEVPTEKKITFTLNDTEVIEKLESVSTKLTEIVGEKTISLTTKGRALVVTALNSIRSIVKAIPTKVSIKVQASLTADARKFFEALKSLTVAPKLSGKHIAAVIAASDKVLTMANGGYLRSGDLFVANENGKQEMVGRIGNRPAVANQDQIGDAILHYMNEHDRGSETDADAIAAAVVKGLKQAGIGAVYLDGKQLASSINRETQRTGRPAITF
ncbi:MAG: hypothetical protein Q4E18_02765 [Clostridia bacterium]|nr:hypothetical protein [Clostridia bacterium]